MVLEKKTCNWQKKGLNSPSYWATTGRNRDNYQHGKIGIKMQGGALTCQWQPQLVVYCDLWSTQQKRNYAWNWKPSQPHGTSGVMDLIKESTMTNIILYYIVNLTLVPADTYSSYHQRILSLQKMKTFTENPNWTQCRDPQTKGSLTPRNTST